MESNTQKRIRLKKEGSEKVYEDDKWVIIRPFTIEASTIYGRNTQWCTVRNHNTIVDKIQVSLFYGYVSSGGVYYIIDKSTSSRDNKYRKVGLQKNWDTTELWNDATSTPLTSKQISSFKDKLNPNMIESINNNWDALKPTHIEKVYLNPISIIKGYYNNNLSQYLSKIAVKHETTLYRLNNLSTQLNFSLVRLILLVLINFLLSLPMLLIISLFRKIKDLFRGKS